MEEREHDGADATGSSPSRSRMRIDAGRRRSGSASGSVADIDAQRPAISATSHTSELATSGKTGMTSHTPMATSTHVNSDSMLAFPSSDQRCGAAGRVNSRPARIPSAAMATGRTGSMTRSTPGVRTASPSGPSAAPSSRMRTTGTAPVDQLRPNRTCHGSGRAAGVVAAMRSTSTSPVWSSDAMTSGMQ